MGLGPDSVDFSCVPPTTGGQSWPIIGLPVGGVVLQVGSVDFLGFSHKAVNFAGSSVPPATGVHGLVNSWVSSGGGCLV